MKRCNGLFYGINDFRITLKKNKLYFIIAAVCIAIGIAAAIKDLPDYINAKEPLSFIGYIVTGEYPFGKIFLAVIVLPFLLCASIILFSFNYYSIFSYYLELIIASYVVFRNSLAVFKVETFFGLCSLFFYVLPLFVFNAVLITAFWTEIYSSIGYPCRKKILYVIPYRCHWDKTKKTFLRTMTIVLIGNVAFTAVTSLVFHLIFHS